ncbi:MAG TPA: peptidoglycan endopeptidase [Ignavibacteria bacterium]
MKVFSAALLFIFCLCFTSCSEKPKVQAEKKDTLKPVTTPVKSDSLSGIKYAVSKYFTPVLNTPDFKSVYGGINGSTLKRSSNGLIKEVEYAAYPGSGFEILEEYDKGTYKIYKVKTEEYEIPLNGSGLFIDSRFVEIKNTKPEKRKVILPSEKEIYDYLDKSIGAMYVWGANNIDGVPQMTEFYPPKSELTSSEKKEWSLKGLDCSGLIYEATRGYTARNTHQLVSYGEPVKIAGLSATQISSKVKPLDLIVWKGHVIVVYDKNTTIESSFTAGKVVKKNLIDVLEKLTLKRKPVDEWSGGIKNEFVIRRWYGTNDKHQ